MKKVIYLFIALEIIFSSCSKFSVDIAKRKYRPGYFVNISKDKSRDQIAARERTMLRRERTANPAPLINSYPLLNVPGSAAGVVPATDGEIEQQHFQKSHESVDKIVSRNAEKKVDDVKISAAQKERQKKSADKSFLLMTGLVGIISVALLRLRLKSAKKISHWAKNNKWKARFASGISHLTLAVAAVLAGKDLQENKYHISPLANNIMTGVFVSAALLYPSKKSRTDLFNYPYLRQKTADIALTLSGVMLLASASNEFHADRSSSAAKMLTTVTEKYFPAPAAAGEDFTYTNENDTRDKSLVKSKNDGGDTVGKILLLLLAIVLCVVLLAVVGGISCQLSCSGNEGAAYLVLLLGVPGVITLFVIAVKAIFKEPDSK